MTIKNTRRGFTQQSCLPKGFTLIELLVVALIIGVLAAVALPQYQKAVMKSRFIQLQTAGDAFIKAYQLYRLEHGEDPQTFEQLDILPTVGTLSEDKLILYFTEDEQSFCRMYANAQEMDCRRPNTPHLVYYFPTFGGFTAKKDKRVCRGFNETQKQVCLNVGGRFVNDGSTYTDYSLP